MIDYVKVESLEDMAEQAREDVSNDMPKVNYIISCEITKNNLIDNVLMDVEDKARSWSANTCPSNLYFNHGQYVKDGVVYIAEELKRKPSSNRALYSLLSQDDISGSGDKPIPSFMLFQSVLDSGCLYCTVYFRALEVSEFFRINLEEIRQNIISFERRSVSFNYVRLVVFAFRAYNKPGFNPLERPKLDQMTALKILTKLENQPHELGELIREKATSYTVIDSSSLKHILECLEDHPEKIQLSNRRYMIDKVSKAIVLSDELAEYRQRHSHDNGLDSASSDLTGCLDSIAREFDKCR